MRKTIMFILILSISGCSSTPDKPYYTKKQDDLILYSPVNNAFTLESVNGLGKSKLKFISSGKHKRLYKETYKSCKKVDDTCGQTRISSRSKYWKHDYIWNPKGIEWCPRHPKRAICREFKYGDFSYYVRPSYAIDVKSFKLKSIFQGCKDITASQENKITMNEDLSLNSKELDFREVYIEFSIDKLGIFCINCERDPSFECDSY